MEPRPSDSEQILRVQAMFCRAIDREDHAGMKACFWPDATVDLGAFVGSPEEFVDWPLRKDPHNRSAHHQMGQSLLEVVGDGAVCETYFIYAGIRLEDDGMETLSDARGRFLDRFARRDGQWRIVDRKVVMDSMHVIQRPGPATAEPSPYLRGAPDSSDPSYQILPMRR